MELKELEEKGELIKFLPGEEETYLYNGRIWVIEKKNLGLSCDDYFIGFNGVNNIIKSIFGKDLRESIERFEDHVIISYDNVSDDVSDDVCDLVYLNSKAMEIFPPIVMDYVETSDLSGFSEIEAVDKILSDCKE